jgi:hypothetical protein
MLSLLTLLAPPDPGQLNEQPLPLGQEYCHSNASSNPLGWGRRTSDLFPSSAREAPERLKSSNAAARIVAQRTSVLTVALPPASPFNHSYKSDPFAMEGGPKALRRFRVSHCWLYDTVNGFELSGVDPICLDRGSKVPFCWGRPPLLRITSAAG